MTYGAHRGSMTVIPGCVGHFEFRLSGLEGIMIDPAPRDLRNMYVRVNSSRGALSRRRLRTLLGV